MDTVALLTAQSLSATSMGKVLFGREYVRKSPAERFWQFVTPLSDAECWNWRASRDKLGYGRMSIIIEGKHAPVLAHRVALALSGVDVPSGTCVIHICDNPSCCNPNHLRLGTKHENNSDMREKKRSARGQKNGKAKLTNEQAFAIDDALKAGEAGRSIAKRFGISEMTVSMIKHRKRWIYLDEMREEAK